MSLLNLGAHLRPHGGPGRLVVFDGDPGAGKTTVLSRLSPSLLGAIVSPELNHLESMIAPRAVGSDAADAWYLAAEQARSMHIRSWMREKRHVLQDRGILGTLAFVYAETRILGDRSRFRRLVRRYSLGDVLLPDALIIMHVEPQAGMNRRRAFAGMTEYRPWFNEEFLAHYGKFFRIVVPTLTACPVVTIETTMLSVDEVVATVMEVLTRLGLDRPDAQERL